VGRYKRPQRPGDWRKRTSRKFGLPTGIDAGLFMKKKGWREMGGGGGVRQLEMVGARRLRRDHSPMRIPNLEKKTPQNASALSGREAATVETRADSTRHHKTAGINYRLL